MKKIFQKLIPTSAFAKNILITFSGTAFAQLFTVVVAPIQTRLYTPENFGVLALFMSFTYLFGIGFNGKYDFAILLPKEERNGRKLLQLVLLLSLSMGLLFTLIIIVLKILWKIDFGLGNWIYLLPTIGTIVALYQGFSFWFNRRESYSILSKNKVIKAVINGLIAVLLGFLGYTDVGLILALLIAQFIALVHLIYVFVKQCSFDNKITYAEMKEVALRYIDFPKYMLPSNLAQRGAVEAPVLLLTSFFSSKITGYFSLAQRVFIAPGSLIVTSVSNVFRQEATVLYHKHGRFDNLLVSLSKRIALVVIPSTILCSFFIVDFIVFVFGDEWGVAGEYTLLLLPMFALQFIVVPTSTSIIIVEKQKILLYLQTFLLLGVILAFVIGYYVFESSKVSISLFSLVYSCKYVFEFLLSYKYSKGEGIRNEV